MEKYVILVSSLYPIDLTAGLFGCLINRNSSLLILFNEKAEIPDDLGKRQFVARSALPTFRWTTDSNGVWRQIHLALENRGQEEFITTLVAVGKSAGEYLERAGDKDIAEQIVLRSRTLAEEAINNNPICEWWSFSSQLIKEIFVKVTKNTNIEVELFGDYRIGNKKARETKEFIKRLFLELNNNDWEVGYPVKGGYAEVCKVNGNRWLRHYAIGDDATITYRKRKSGKIREEALKSGDIKDDDKIRFGGCLETGLLQHFGTLVHLPWYCQAEYACETGDDFAGYEFISPISVADAERTSDEIGGGGWRLNPTGYSLLEYKHETINKLARAVYKDSSITYNNLRDWRYLFYNYPVVKQKVAKHQKSVRAYRDFRVRQEIKRIRSGNFGGIESLTNHGEKAIVELGCILIEAIALLKVMLVWSSPKNECEPPKSIMRKLEDLKWLDERKKLRIDALFTILSEIFKRTGQWLCDMGMSKEIWHRLLNEYGNYSKNLLLLNGLTIIQDAKVIPAAKTPSIGKFVNVLNNLADHYYGFAIFSGATIFKANVLSSYLLLGQDDYAKAIYELIEERGHKKYFRYIPHLLESKK